MKKLARQCVLPILVAATVMVASCVTRQAELQVEGHYTYSHSFDYDLNGDHLEVSETGTMDFSADGSALDSARQTYTATLQEGGVATIVFDYVSPSVWRLDGKSFRFAGVKDEFRMEVVESGCDGCDTARAAQLAEKVMAVVGGSIDHEYDFHLDTLTSERLQWSYTYKDGHSDTWEFERAE